MIHFGVGYDILWLLFWLQSKMCFPIPQVMFGYKLLLFLIMTSNDFVMTFVM
mgnify:CR=1 FL=1